MAIFIPMQICKLFIDISYFYPINNELLKNFNLFTMKNYRLMFENNLITRSYCLTVYTVFLPSITDCIMYFKNVC